MYLVFSKFILKFDKVGYSVRSWVLANTLSTLDNWQFIYILHLQDYISDVMQRCYIYVYGCVRNSSKYIRKIFDPTTVQKTVEPIFRFKNVRLNNTLLFVKFLKSSRTLLFHYLNNLLRSGSKGSKLSNIIEIECSDIFS